MSILFGLLAAAVIGSAIIITLPYLNKRVLENEAKKLATQYQNEIGSTITGKLTKNDYNVFDLNLTGSLGKKTIRIEAANVDTTDLFSKMKL